MHDPTPGEVERYVKNLIETVESVMNSVALFETYALSATIQGGSVLS
jgi:hypothetical protein